MIEKYNEDSICSQMCHLIHIHKFMMNDDRKQQRFICPFKKIPVRVFFLFVFNLFVCLFALTNDLNYVIY